jgi:hypothetical protein
VSDLSLRGEVRVQGPVLQPGWIVTSIPLHERTGLYFPSDIKSLRSGELKSLRMNSQTPTSGSILISILSIEPPTIAPTGGFGFLRGWTLDVPDELTSTTIQALNSSTVSIPMIPVVSSFTALQAPGTASFDWRQGEVNWVNPAQPAGFTESEVILNLLSVERRTSELGTQSRETILWTLQGNGAWPQGLRLPQLPQWPADLTANMWDLRLKSSTADATAQSRVRREIR